MPTGPPRHHHVPTGSRRIFNTCSSLRNRMDLSIDDLSPTIFPCDLYLYSQEGNFIALYLCSQPATPTRVDERPHPRGVVAPHPSSVQRQTTIQAQSTTAFWFTSSSMGRHFGHAICAFVLALVCISCVGTAATTGTSLDGSV